MRYSTPAPTIPPTTCAAMYGTSRVVGKRPPVHKPNDTAGLKCPPEIGPSAYAPVTTVSPKASDTPSNPMPTSGNAAASTALPHPPRTSQNVPMNSADSLANTAASFAAACDDRMPRFKAHHCCAADEPNPPQKSFPCAATLSCRGMNDIEGRRPNRTGSFRVCKQSPQPERHPCLSRRGYDGHYSRDSSGHHVL